MKKLVLIVVLSLFISNVSLAIGIAGQQLDQSEIETTQPNLSRDNRMRAMRQGNQLNSHLSKNLQIKASKLKDSTGLVYVGGRVRTADLAPYLKQLKA